jgi:hypothetical protein
LSSAMTTCQTMNIIGRHSQLTLRTNPEGVIIVDS